MIVPSRREFQFERRQLYTIAAAFSCIVLFRFSSLFLVEIGRATQLVIPQGSEGMDRMVLFQLIESSSSLSLEADKDEKRNEWLKGPRLGNIRQGMTQQLVDDMILRLPLLLSNNKDHKSNTKGISLSDPAASSVPRQAHNLLGKSLCMPESRFLNDAALDHENPKNVRLWIVRLVFLVIHYHQHAPALAEAQARWANASAAITPTELEQHDVGLFDYQCPDSKFLLVSLAGVGIGANVRTAMVPVLMAGLATDRIVLFVNHAQLGNITMGPWELASCDRYDFQCFFMPTTPCTLTRKDLMNSFITTRAEGRAIIRENKLPVGHESDRVIHVEVPFNPPPWPSPSLRERIAHYANLLIDNSITNYDEIQFRPNPDEGLTRVWKKAVHTILVEDGKGLTYYDNTVAHALSFYAMRPNPVKALELATIRKEIIPENLNVEQTIGLPIRASDKCGGESECLTFEQHMEVTSRAWGKHLEHLKTVAYHSSGLTLDDSALLNPTIVFTTEAKDVLDQQIFFAKNQQQRQQQVHNTTITNTMMSAMRYPYLFNWVTNTKDILPGTGKLSKHDRNADAAMVSSMSSLQAQLMARVSIGNSCSNFHGLLSDYLVEGCGAASDNSFVDLREYEDPRLRICCQWSNGCKERKQMHLANLTAAASTIQESYSDEDGNKNS